MRLYVNENEIDALKTAIINRAERIETPLTEREKLTALYQRVELCEQLQHNVKRAGGSNNDLT